MIALMGGFLAMVVFDSKTLKQIVAVLWLQQNTAFGSQCFVEATRPP
jgi:hypothetical protein